MLEDLPEPDYPDRLDVRCILRCGKFRFKKKQLFRSQALGEENIPLEETSDGIWSLFSCDVLLARLDERDFKRCAAVP